MILTLDSAAVEQEVLAALERVLEAHPGVTIKPYRFQGSSDQVVELHLIGDTRVIPQERLEHLRGVRSVVRVSAKYRLIGRPPGTQRVTCFEYNGVRFDESSVNIFAGLCAVDRREHVAEMFRALAAAGIVTTRMGVYKPRTSPYDFQGLGAECLPWLFELAGEHGIRVIAIEVCNERQLDEVIAGLERAGRPTGVMLQIGTRNAQNFELLKQVGQQRELPVLFKRGMGLTLEESLNACEYIASEGNSKIVFGLRGVKSHLGEPHRNLVDFALVPVVRRLTCLPVCIDPSHSVGRASVAPDGLPDIWHATGQGIIAGASMVLVEFHPHPQAAVCDGHQALTLPQLPVYAEYVRRVRRAYEDVAALTVNGL